MDLFKYLDDWAIVYYSPVKAILQERYGCRLAADNGKQLLVRYHLRKILKHPKSQDNLERI
ncbi:hypothetical protein L484_005087 [Morus notabilis]|uniref:Uncharacterized protein n=1 Tax=Morus notabilis TaxID=981085 RepID=W9QG91_9ROSA|nr:hypothetical protein L484_005087 [Morus notabilis]